jgi:hypothetical protein
LALTGAAAAGAWEQPRGAGLVITQAGVAFPDGGDTRLLNEGYAEWGIGGAFTAVMTFDSVVEAAQSQTIWHGTLGLRYSHRFDFLPDIVFGLEPRGGYQTHDSVITDPVFAGDGWSYGLRFDAGTAFEVWDCHAFANLGASASTPVAADGEYKLELVAGIDLAEDWQVSLGYFGNARAGRAHRARRLQQARSRTDACLAHGRGRSLAASLTQTVYADRTAEETAIRLALVDPLRARAGK